MVHSPCSAGPCVYAPLIMSSSWGTRSRGASGRLRSRPRATAPDLATMRAVAVGAIFRRVVDRFCRLDLGGDVFVTADSQVRRVFDGELVQVLLGLVALLTFSDFAKIRPVAVLMISDVGVAFTARTRGGRVDRPGRFGRARPGLRRTGQQECAQGNDKARRTRPSLAHCSTPFERIWIVESRTGPIPDSDFVGRNHPRSWFTYCRSDSREANDMLPRLTRVPPFAEGSLCYWNGARLSAPVRIIAQPAPRRPR